MPRHNNPANRNGHARRALRARILTEEDNCAICGQPVDKTLTTLPGHHSRNCPNPATCPGCAPHPMRPEIDEDIPRSRGGNPLQRENCHLTHRQCNRAKGTHTLNEHHNPPPQPNQTTNLINW